jgi:hypothetical protein
LRLPRQLASVRIDGQWAPADAAPIESEDVMDDKGHTATDGGAIRFAYFVLRIQRDEEDPEAGLKGVLERLGSGRARRFDGAEELLGLLIDGAEGRSSSKRQPGRG